MLAAIRKKVESKLKQDAKGTLGDYIRLVQLEKELEGSDPAEIKAGWVETKKEESDSAE